MYAFTNPSRLAGFTGAIALLVAAHLGDQATVLGAFVACVPWVFLLCLLQPRHAGAPGVAVTMLGLAWIGLAFAHAVLLRDLPHGDGIVIDVLVGTFIGDTGAYLGGRALGTRRLAPSISPNKTIEGLAIGFAGRRRRGVAGRALPGLAERLARADPRRGGRARRRRSATSSSPTSSATPGRRTPGACSAPTAARWIASTPRCSRWSPGSTSGTRCCSSDWTSYITSDIIPPWPAAVERPPPAVLKLC